VPDDEENKQENSNKAITLGRYPYGNVEIEVIARVAEESGEEPEQEPEGDKQAADAGQTEKTTKESRWSIDYAF